MAHYSDYDEEIEEGKVEGRHTFSVWRILVAFAAGAASVLFVLVYI